MPRDKEALKSGLTSYRRSLQQCLAKVRTFFRAPQSDMLPDITMLRISAQVSRDKADRKPDNLFKNSTAEPLKGGVNVCIRLRPSMGCKFGWSLRWPWVRRPSVEVSPDRHRSAAV